MSYTHFTIAECSKIETLIELGFSIRWIAQKLDRVPSSVCRELKRNLIINVIKHKSNPNKRKPIVE